MPDVASMADRLRSCLQASEDVSRDLSTLFDMQLFKFDTDYITESIALYEKLKVKHEPLTLIPPQFETPMPSLQPAVFPPSLKELPGPHLELFDLDEQFASEKTKLAQLTNKCQDKDLDYYITDACNILGLGNEVPDRSNPKAVLYHIFNKLVSEEDDDRWRGRASTVPSDETSYNLKSVPHLSNGTSSPSASRYRTFGLPAYSR